VASRRFAPVRFVPLLLLLCLPFAPAPAASGAEPPVLAALAKAGWTASEPVRTFSPDNLFEEIDGEAELYLPYDFRALSVAILTSAAAPGVELRLESFRHGTPKDAFGIFSQYRFPEQETAAVGPSTAAVSDASLDFFRGDTFVRLRVASGTLTREALLAAGRTVVEALSGPATAPPGAGVVAIPAAVPGTVIYQKKAMLGYEPLAPGYEARFADGALSGRVIFMDGGDGGTGRRDKLAGALPGFRAAGEGEWVAALPQGVLYLKAAGSGTVGVIGKLSRAQAAPYLEALLKNAAASGAPPAAR
jgi:hypothetical protein